MLLFLDSPQIPGKTFTLTVEPSETIARARAAFLHILFNAGLGDVPPRFSFNGVFMKDKLTFEDYELNNAAGDGIRIKYFLEPQYVPTAYEDSDADSGDEQRGHDTAEVRAQKENRSSVLTSLEQSLGVQLKRRGKPKSASRRKSRRFSLRGSAAPAGAATAVEQRAALSTFYNPYLITEPEEATDAVLRQQAVVKLLPDGETAPPHFEDVDDIMHFETRARKRRLQNMLVVSALKAETDWFIHREQLIMASYVCLWILALCLIPVGLADATTEGVPPLMIAVIFVALLFSAPLMLWRHPYYSRIGGFMLPMTPFDKVFVRFGLAFFVVMAMVASTLFGLEAASMTAACSLQTDTCTDRRAFVLVGLFMVTAASLAVTVVFYYSMANFEYRAGDLIEEELVGDLEPKVLIEQALRGSPDVRRAGCLRIAALLSDDDKPEVKMAFKDEGFALVLCSLAVSDDDVVRAYACEALLAFCTENSCRRAFVDEGGLNSTVSLVHHGSEVDGVKMDHRQQTADDAIVALAWVLQEPDVQSMFFDDANMIMGLATRVEKGAFSDGSMLVLAQMFNDMLGRYEEHRGREGSHESIAACLVAILKSTDVDQLVLTLQTAMLMFDMHPTDLVARRYVRGVMEMGMSYDLDVIFLRAQFLNKVAVSRGAAAQYLLTFGAELIAALRSFLATELLDLVRLTVAIVKELIHSDTNIIRYRAELAAVTEEASAMDDSSAFQALVKEVRETLAQLIKGKFKKIGKLAIRAANRSTRSKKTTP